MNVDADEEAPINPFHFWKDRIRDEESATSSSTSRFRRDHAASNTSRPSAQQSSHPRPSQAPPLPSGELRSRQGPPQALAHSSTTAAPQQHQATRRTPPPRPQAPAALRLSPSREQGTTATSSPKKVQSLPMTSPSKLQAHVGEQKQIATGWFGVSGGSGGDDSVKSSGSSSNSDANSYMPSFRKALNPVRAAPTAETSSSSTSTVHKGLKKTTSSPVVPTASKGNYSRIVPRKMPSLGSEDSRRDDIPTIQTTRASGADLLDSLDDLELYRPQRRGKQQGSQGSGGVAVLEVAKKLEDSVFLSPQIARRTNGRRGSSGDMKHYSVSR